ncbi:hypothetical protein GCM10022198_22900 [Klugiella xanthotipulae]|uniref:Uncharacterized protein n=1 Tax=Klugiella xanthotipulae TaxID=244735 RepID=A0A543HYF9_9MICO|nr:hypothetical protein [Klugiella xanthotipulae]TQM63310.1 hypothetical protein FB466_1570 [Klugiella xanthotipulae]
MSESFENTDQDLDFDLDLETALEPDRREELQDNLGQDIDDEWPEPNDGGESPEERGMNYLPDFP